MGRLSATTSSPAPDCVAKAAIEAAQAALAERGEWSPDEQGIVRRAGLGALGWLREGRPP